MTTGVEGSPKSCSFMITYVERSKLVPSPDATSGKHYRKACYWSGECERLKEAKAVLSWDR